MSENGEGRGSRKVVARDPLAELGEIELAGVLRRVRPAPRPEAERRQTAEPGTRPGESSPAPSLSGRPALPGAAVARGETRPISP